MLGLDRGIAAGFYRRNERIGMPIVTVPGRRRQLRQEPTISVVCRAAHGFLRSTSVELLEGLGVGGRDVAVAHVFADDGAVFGFRPVRCRCCGGDGFWSVR